MLFDLIVGVVTALAVSCLVCGAQVGAGPLDMPTVARKAHRSPTPTSGGVGIALGFAAGIIAITLFSSAWRYGINAEGAALLSTCAAFCFGFLGLGFVDDAHPLGARLKFFIFALLSVGAAFSMGVVEKLPLGWDASIYLGLGVGLVGSALWVFTLVNSVNFMDGANGLAMGSVAIGLLSLAALAWPLHPGLVGLALCGAAGLAGFLVWNFPHGRLFAGDSGALFAGALGALAALLVIRRTGVSPFVPPIVFFPLLADVLLTLASRARRRRSLLEGHSEHLYQIAVRAGWSHGRVAIAYWAAMGVCGGIAVIVARSDEPAFAWISLGALALGSVLLSRAVRRWARQRGIEEI